LHDLSASANEIGAVMSLGRINQEFHSECDDHTNY